MIALALICTSVLAALAMARSGPSGAARHVNHVGRARRHTVLVPALTILFPAARATYAADGWRNGCLQGQGVCGKVRYVRGLKVTVAVRQLGSGRYWNGRAFRSQQLLYRRAAVFTSRARGRRAQLGAWFYQLALPGPVGGYTISVRATARRHRRARRLAQKALTFTVQLSSVSPSPAPPVSTPPAAAPAAFEIAGNAQGMLYPGGPSQVLELKLTNPGASPIYVTAIDTSLESSSLPTGCMATDFRLAQAVLPTGGLEVPAGGAVALAGPGVTPPSVQLTDTGADQDACAEAHLTLSYTGSAHS